METKLTREFIDSFDIVEASKITDSYAKKDSYVLRIMQTTRFLVRDMIFGVYNKKEDYSIRPNLIMSIYNIICIAIDDNQRLAAQIYANSLYQTNDGARNMIKPSLEVIADTVCGAKKPNQPKSITPSQPPQQTKPDPQLHQTINPQKPNQSQKPQPQNPATQQQAVTSVANSINPNQYSASNIFAQLLKPQPQQAQSQQQVVNPFQQILQPQAPVPPIPMNSQVQEPIIEFDPLPGKSLKEKATILKNYYKFLGNHPNMTKENVDSLYSYATNNDLIQKIMKCNPKCGANIIMQEIPLRDKDKANYDFCFRVDVDDTHWVRVLVNSNQTIVRDYNNQLRKIPSGYDVTLVTKKNNK